MMADPCTVGICTAISQSTISQSWDNSTDNTGTFPDQVEHLPYPVFYACTIMADNQAAYNILIHYAKSWN